MGYELALIVLLIVFVGAWGGGQAGPPPPAARGLAGENLKASRVATSASAIRVERSAG